MKKTVFRKVLALIMVLSLIPCWGVSAWAGEGDPVSTNGTDPQPVTAGYVDVDVNSSSQSGAFASPINPGGSAEIIVNGPIDVTNSGGDATGIQANAVQIGSEASVSAESVSAESTASGNTIAIGAEANAQSPGPAEATVEVSGTVEASSAGDGATFGAYVRANSPADSVVTAEVSAGDVSATSTGNANTTGVHTVTPPGSNANSTATADVGNVTAVSEGDGYAAGVFAANNDGGRSEITAGDITAEANGDNYAVGVATRDLGGGSTTLEAGNVEATSAGAGASYGVYTRTSGDGSNSDIKDVGNVVATTTGSGTAEGIDVSVDLGGTAVVNAQDVEASAEGTGKAIGINAYGADGGTATVTVGKVEAEAEQNETFSAARGIVVHAYDGTVSVTADEVEAEADKGFAHGINITSDGANSTGTVNVNGPITVTGQEYAYGATITAYDGGTSVLNVTPEGGSSEEALIKAKSETDASGITIWSYNDGTVDVTVEGSIQSDGIGIYSNSDSSSLVDVDVIGDITASEVGLVFNEDGKNAFVVDGTVHGGIVGIQLQDKITSDNLDITVWKIDPSKIGAEDHVVAEKNSGEWTSTATSKEVEANIHYIIKIEPSQENIFTLDGATEHQGYKYTAKQGENVAVKVNVPGGYQLTGAYGYDGGKLPLKIDPNTGDYYVIMPMGGGILLRADLSWIGTGGSGSYSSGDEYAYASYTGNVQYATITFDLNGGHTLTGNPGPVIRSVPVGTWLRLIDAPKKDGSAFELWHTDDETVKACNPFDSFCVMGDVDFIAKWAGEDLPYQPTAEDTLLVNSLVTTSLLPVTERSVEEPIPVDAADSETLTDDTPSVGQFR